MSKVEELTREIDLLEMKVLRSLLRFRRWCVLREKLKQSRPSVASVLKEFSLLKRIDEFELRLELLPLNSTSGGKKALMETLRGQRDAGNGMWVRCISKVSPGFSAAGKEIVRTMVGGNDFCGVADSPDLEFAGGCMLAESLALEIAGGSCADECALCTFGALYQSVCDPALLPKCDTAGDLVLRPAAVMDFGV